MRGAAGVKLRSPISNSYLVTLGFGIEGINSSSDREMVIEALVDYIMGQTPNDDNFIDAVEKISASNYPNPFNPETTIEFSAKNLNLMQV